MFRPTIQLLLLMALALMGCWPETKAPLSVQQPSPLVITIAEDRSISSNHLQWEAAALAEIILADSLRPEIILAGMFIGKESYKQTPFLAGVIRPGIVPISDDMNRYRAAKLAEQNAENRKRFEQEVRMAVNRLCHYMQQPRNHEYTDLYGAFAKAHIFLTQPAFNQSDIDFYIISDLKHDIPGETGAQTFQFPPNVRIISVGRDQKVRFEQLFPGQTVIEIVELRRQFLY